MTGLTTVAKWIGLFVRDLLVVTLMVSVTFASVLLAANVVLELAGSV